MAAEAPTNAHLLAETPPAAQQPDGVVVPASVVDALLQLALATDLGKGVILGFRTTAGVPPVQMTLVAQDAWLVPETGGRP